MSSKLSIENLKKAIGDILLGSQESERKFVETVELQIGLKDYDTQRDKRFAGSVKLPHLPRPRMQVCVIGDAAHCDQAEKLGLAFRTLDDLKKLADSYDAFLASSTLITQIPRVLGPGLNKAGKFPTSLGANDDMASRVADIKSQVKFQLKKVLCMGVAVGHVGMDADQLRQNALMAINFLVSLLKKNWYNVKTLHMKSTMGKVQRIYG